MRILFFAFLLSLPVKGQDIVSKYLEMGDQVPNLSISILTADGTSDITLESLRGKVVILEFWATFCGPCIPAMDHLAKIQNKFPSDLVVIAVTDESRQKVVNFLNKRPSSLRMGLDNSGELNKLFYHQFMPHTILIGPDGYIKAITSPDKITEEVIYITKSGADPAIELKSEFKTEENNQNALGTVNYEDNSLFKMVLGPSQKGVQSQLRKVSETEYEFINCTIPMIYNVLLNNRKGDDFPKGCLEVSQETKEMLSIENSFCFKSKVPSHLQSRLESLSLDYLNQIFELNPEIELRKRNSVALLPIEQSSKEENSEMKSFSVTEVGEYLYEYKLIPYPLSVEGVSTRFFGEIPSQANEVSAYLLRNGYQMTSTTLDKKCVILYKVKNTSKNF